MKKFIILLLVGILLVPIYQANAAFFQSGDNLNITESLKDDLYAAGGMIDVQGSIGGDLIAAGGSITISQSVADDLMVGGGSITVNGNVGDDARLAGGNLEINGTIGDDLIVAGGRVVIGKNAVINGDLNMGAGEVFLSGTVKGKITGGVGTLYVTGIVEGDIEASIDQDLVIAEEGYVNGNVNYSAWKPLNVDANKVGGQVIYSKITEKYQEEVPVKDYVQGVIMTILSLTLLGLLIFKATPLYHQRIVTNFDKLFWKNLIYGIIWLLLVPVLTLFLALSVIGLPIAVALIALYTLSLLIAYVLSGLWIGSKVYQIKKEDIWTKLGQLILGLVIITVLWAIPFGWIVICIVFTITLGSSITNLKIREPKAPKKPKAKKKK